MVYSELIKQICSLSLSGPPLFKQDRDVRGIWSGDLPPRNYTNPRFSLKIFVGGVPWDVSEVTLMDAFRPYGVSHVEWPGQSPRSSKGRGREEKKPTGYVYVVFKSELSISFLLADCIQSCHASPGELYFSMKTGPCLKDYRQVQIIPWVCSDSVYWSPFIHNIRHDSSDSGVEKSNTVFVGALHGLITASTLANIMEETYGGTILRVVINTDKYKYPIGSGRVTFAGGTSYKRAVNSKFLEIRTSKFMKKIQIDPFMEEPPLCRACRCRGCHVSPSVQLSQMIGREPLFKRSV